MPLGADCPGAGRSDRNVGAVDKARKVRTTALAQMDSRRRSARHRNGVRLRVPLRDGWRTRADESGSPGRSDWQRPRRVDNEVTRGYLGARRNLARCASTEHVSPVEE